MKKNIIRAIGYTIIFLPIIAVAHKWGLASVGVPLIISLGVLNCIILEEEIVKKVKAE